MQTVTATEFKAKCLRLLDEVNRTGEALIISKHGKPVARVVPENVDKPWLALRGSGRFIGDPFEPTVHESEIESLK
jgi:prevent-host-death family protein